MTAQLLSSDEWCEVLGVDVRDPDGWDRKNFDESWGEAITRHEFEQRCMRSTASWTGVTSD